MSSNKGLTLKEKSLMKKSLKKWIIALIFCYTQRRYEARFTPKDPEYDLKFR